MSAPRILGIDARLANEAQPAGVGNFCTEMLRALPEVIDGWTLRLYLDQAPRAGFPLAADQFDARVLPPRRFWTHRALGGELRRDAPDVFYSPVTQLPLACPCPTVATVHDLAFLDFTEHFDLRRRAIARLQARYVVHRAARLCADSEATRQDIQKHYGTPPERVTVTLAGVSQRFQPVADPEVLAALRRRYSLPEHFVLHVGRLQPRKNIARLIAAFEQVVTQHPDLPHGLVIAGGKGWMYDAIFAAAQASAVRDRIHFAGFIAGEDLPALLSAADLLALVSLWEGFGLPVLEAMACGTAVLTSNCSSLPEVAGDAALLVNPEDTASIADGLRTLLCEDARRRERALRGPAQAARFGWFAAASRLMVAVEQASRHGNKTR